MHTHRRAAQAEADAQQSHGHCTLAHCHATTLVTAAAAAIARSKIQPNKQAPTLVINLHQICLASVHHPSTRMLFLSVLIPREGPGSKASPHFPSPGGWSRNWLGTHPTAFSLRYLDMAMA